jgi:UDP-N-acetylglucosamine transferase subunit ALG13
MNAALAQSLAPKHRVFLTVGAQMPFDRLVRAVDAWAAARPAHVFFAQIGDSAYVPRHLEWTRILSPHDFDRRYDDADAIVGHAGIGTLFAALERGKPIVVMPRRGDLHETRNDHQLATARRFEALAGVTIAWDERELSQKLVTLARPSLALAHEAHGSIVRTIADFIDRD